MNREQKIADLVLHGYVPYANVWDWVAIWNGETGRMAKHFGDGADGPGWDVRVILQLNERVIKWHEVPWHRISDDQLAQLLLQELPPKFRHNVTAAVPLGQRGHAGWQA